MLQLNEEDDDATSKLAEPPLTSANPKDEPLDVLGPDVGELQSGGVAVFRGVSFLMAFGSCFNQ